MNCIELIEKIENKIDVSKSELVYLLENITDDEAEILRKKAQATALKSFGNN